MSSIVVKYSQLNEKFDIVADNLESSYGDIYIGVDIPDGKGTVVFDNLSFGYKLTNGPELINDETWPPPGVRYIQTDQDILQTERVYWKPEKTLTLYVWFKNAGVKKEVTYNFDTPRPVSPYPSWIWNGSSWQPPIPYPTDGNTYMWDESTQQWVKVGS